VIDHRGPRNNYQYDKYEITSTSTDGYSRKESTDVMGNVLRIEEEGDSGEPITVTYGYDAVSRLRKTTRGKEIADGESPGSYREYDTTYTYDVRDNVDEMYDPDLGKIEYGYDSYGSIVWSKKPEMKSVHGHTINLGV